MTTNSELFVTITDHLLKQGRKAMDQPRAGGRCAYRGEGGTKCAIGCLISDEDYTFDMEGSPLARLVEEFGGPGSDPLMGQARIAPRPTIQALQANMEFLEAMQTFHDGGAWRGWRLLELARGHGVPEVLLSAVAEAFDARERPGR